MSHRHRLGLGKGAAVDTPLLIFVLAVALIFVGACGWFGGPEVDERTDGDILATLTVGSENYRAGDAVEVVFTIKNVSGEPLVLQREDAFVQDIILISHEVEGTWSQQSGRDLHKLELVPGESSTIEWVIEDLKDGHYAFLGEWWSAGRREMHTSVGFNHGSVYY